MKDVVIFMGAAGSGKGTQAKVVAERNGWNYVSTGDLFRQLLADPSTSAEEKNELERMKQGFLLSDEFIFKVTFAALEKMLVSGKGIVLDGAVRTLNQAEGYYNFFKERNILDRVLAILIELTEDEARNRLTKRRMCISCGNPIPWIPETKDIIKCPKCGGELEVRLDDTPEAIEQRLKVQGPAAAEPVFSFFEERGFGARIDGVGTIKEVEDRVRAVLEK